MQTNLNQAHPLSVRCLQLAALYFAVGILMGMYMGIMQNFSLTAVHAHTNLLGWVSLALAAAIFRLWPEAAQTHLAKVYFWSYNLSLPVSMVLLACLMSGVQGLGTYLMLANCGILLGGLSFVLNIWLTVRKHPQLLNNAAFSKHAPSFSSAANQA